MTFADTSFFLTLVLKDIHYPVAARWLKVYAENLNISSLVGFETENKLRTLCLTKELDEASFQRAQLDVAALLRGAIRLRHPGKWPALLAESRRMIHHFSPGVPHGTMDVVHVASARVLRMESFLTFDDNQRGLARAAGFKAPDGREN